MDAKVGEPIGFDRTEFRFLPGPGVSRAAKSLIGTVTEVPANNPAGRMFFTSLRSLDVAGETISDSIVHLAPNRLSALKLIEEARVAFQGAELPPLKAPRRVARPISPATTPRKPVL